MTKPYLELVGVLLEHSIPNQSYRWNNCYLLCIGYELEGNIIQKGYDIPLNEDFQHIVWEVADAFATVIDKMWRQGSAKHESIYLQFKPGYGPNLIGLGGQWNCFVEW